MKYLGFDVLHGEVATRIVVAFPDSVVHADMAVGVEHALRLSFPHARCVRLVTAGGVLARAISIEGGPESTGKGEDRWDLLSFNTADYGGNMRTIKGDDS